MAQNSRNGHYVTFSANGAMTNGHARPVEPTVAEESIDQVRDLLFGAFRREMDQRLGGLERRMDALERQLLALGDEHTRERKATLDQLSRGVATLADDIRRIQRGS